MSRRVFRLIPDEISHDMAECIKTINADVQAGQAVGMAYVLIFRGGEYLTNTAGVAHTNNTIAMASVGVLLTQLQMKEMGL